MRINKATAEITNLYDHLQGPGGIPVCALLQRSSDRIISNPVTRRVLAADRDSAISNLSDYYKWSGRSYRDSTLIFLEYDHQSE
jgi:hypothetical protein